MGIPKEGSHTSSGAHTIHFRLVCCQLSTPAWTLYPFAAAGIFPTDNTAAVFVTYGLAAATNVVLTTLTGKVIILGCSSEADQVPQLAEYCGSGVIHHALLLMQRSAVVITPP
jgi:hypothetical protein